MKTRPYIDNLIKDKEKKILIPQNKNKNFLIEKYKKWDSTIKISFNFKEDIDYINLFFIIKSYSNNSKFSPYAICSIYKNESNEEIITQKENISFFKNIELEKFIEWIDHRIQNDSKYNENEEFYGIIFIFNKALLEITNKELREESLDILKPKYPWTIEWIDNFKNTLQTIDYLKKKIETYEKIIKKL